MTSKENPSEELKSVLFNKHNTLIYSNYSGPLMGRKIIDLGLSKIKKVEKRQKDDDGRDLIQIDYIAEMSGAELREMMGTSSTSLYNRISELTNPKPVRKADGTLYQKPKLQDWVIVYRNDEKQEFKSSTVINSVEFKNGKMRLEFNKNLAPLLEGYRNNYTKLDIAIISKITSVHSYILYQMFKKTIDMMQYQTKKHGPFVLDTDLCDLKLLLGMIMTKENPILEKAAANTKVWTMDAIQDIDDKVLLNKINEFKNFKRYAITKAVKEINEKTDIDVKVKDRTGRKGGKGVGFTFTLQYKKYMGVEEAKTDPEVDILDLIDEVREFTGNTFSSKEIRTIIEDAEYDIEVTKNAYEAMLQQIDNVNEKLPWMRSAVKKKIKPNKFSVQRKERKNEFTNIPQSPSYQGLSEKDYERLFVDNN